MGFLDTLLKANTGVLLGVACVLIAAAIYKIAAAMARPLARRLFPEEQVRGRFATDSHAIDEAMGDTDGFTRLRVGDIHSNVEHLQHDTTTSFERLNRRLRELSEQMAIIDRSNQSMITLVTELTEYYRLTSPSDNQVSTAIERLNKNLDRIAGKK